MPGDRLGLGPGAEFDLIRSILAGAAAGDVVVGPGDDATVLRGGVVLTADLTIEGVHFRREWLSPEEIGWRATVATLSDLAAMAAAPVGVLLSLAVPEAESQNTASRLAAGVRSAAERWGAALIGGDVTRSPGPWILDVIGVGTAEKPALRSGARVGDELWVTGALGGAAAAVRGWQEGRKPHPAARNAFAAPVARIEEARWLAERGLVHALLDISDGLAGDASHIAAASHVQITLDEAAIPVHPGAVAYGDALRLALSGGEDYELCFASPVGRVQSERHAFEERFGVALTQVGAIQGGQGVHIQRRDGSLETVAADGFQHFGTEVQ